MNAQKALELLKQRHVEDSAHAEADLYQADQIAIEALELVSRLLECPYCHGFFTLPSAEKPQ